jgi:hypothetical protein
LPFLFKDDPSRLFCSQLVAEAYERAGAPLVEGKEPTKITPRLLDESSTLKPLDQIPLRKPIDRNIPPLDRDAGYLESPLAQELRAFQNAFKAVQRELDHMIGMLQVTPRPGSLSELFGLLAKAEVRGAHQQVAPVIKVIEQALEDEKYFDLYPHFAREAEAAFSHDLEFANSEQATASARSYLARQSAEFAAEYRHVAYSDEVGR